MFKTVITTAIIAISSTAAFAENNSNVLGGTIVEGDSIVTTTTNANTQVGAAVALGNHTVTNLTTSGADTCFGSTTGGVSVAGFGASQGKTYTDSNCEMIKNVKLLASLGLTDAAVVLAMQSNAAIAQAVTIAYPELAQKFAVNAAITGQ